ncbi:MAG: rod-binding protein [Alphaproteobacteria bacterium]|nr:rod-binding protein [Alphaproteobacteria bacterium]
MSDGFGLAQNLLDINLQPQAPDLKLVKRLGDKNAPKDVLRETAQQFESFFLQTVLESMTKTIGSEDTIGDGGNAEKIWRSQMNEHFAEAITQSGGIGIADSVYKELLALQEENRNGGGTKSGEESAKDSSTNKQAPSK